MVFVWADNLLLLLLVPVMALFLVWRWRVRAASLQRIGDRDLIERLAGRVHYGRRIYQNLLWLVGLSLVIIALARPTWGQILERVETESQQVVIAIDISRSMDAQDIRPSRLERAILDVRQLLTTSEGVDVAVILFTNEAFKYVPMTYDLQTVERYLLGISTDAITQQGTSLEQALRVAWSAFDLRRGGEKSILLVTDGENHEGDPIDVAREIASEGGRVHILGYGTEAGAVIPVYEDGQLVDYKIDANGALVETRANGDLMRSMARDGGGILQWVNGQDVGITPILDVLAGGEGDVQETIIRVPIEQYGWFVFVALILLTMDMLTQDVRRAA